MDKSSKKSLLISKAPPDPGPENDRTGAIRNTTNLVTLMYELLWDASDDEK
jgi:hypothetical protein